MSTTPIKPAALTVEDLALLRRFMSPRQVTVVHSLMRGEERQFFIDKLTELATTIKTMPATYEQDGKGEDAIVYLHYFAGGSGNWYITEKDKETPEEPGQHQAFGLADLFNDGGEFGYISIIELMRQGVEMDFHFKPCTLRELRQKRGIAA